MAVGKFFNSLLASLKSGISRFITPFIFILGIFLTLSYFIIWEDEQNSIMYICYSLALGAVFSVLLTILCERWLKIKKVTANLLPVIPAVVCYFILQLSETDEMYVQMGYFGIIIAFVALIIYLLYTNDNSKLLIPYLVKNLAFAALISAIISGGVAICIAAFQYLIYDFNEFYKVYQIVLLFVWCVIFTFLFLSRLPKVETYLTLPKLYKTLVLYVGLPIYMLLLFILYIYLIDIVIKWEMPVGEINWFASFASLFFIFFYFNVRQYEEKAAVLFRNLAGLLIIPVIIIQSVAIAERLYWYGLTTPRFVSVILVCIALAFAVMSVTGKHIEKIFLVLGFISLIVTLTPLNVIDIPKSNQTYRLTSALERNGMLSGDDIIPNSSANENDREIIEGSYDYLISAAGKKPEYLEKISIEQRFENIFGFYRKTSDYRSSIYCNYSSSKPVDIADFGQLIPAFTYNTNLQYESDGEKFDVDLKPVMQSIYEKYGEESKELDLYQISPQTFLYIEELNFTIENSEFSYVYLRGFILIKG